MQPFAPFPSFAHRLAGACLLTLLAGCAVGAVSPRRAADMQHDWKVIYPFQK
jgi:hypothetical protein